MTKEKKEAVSIRIDARLKSELLALADKEKRSLANLIEIILNERVEKEKN